MPHGASGFITHGDAQYLLCRAALIKPLPDPMNLFRAITGQYKHWNDTCGRVIETLERRVKSLDRDQQIVFSNLLAYSTVVADYLVGPDKGDERLLDVDPKSIDADQAKWVYIQTIAAMSRMYEMVNPSTSVSVRAGFTKLIGTNLNGEPPAVGAAPRQPDLKQFGPDLWASVLNICKSRQDASAIGAFPFTTLLGSVTREAFSDIREEMSRRNEGAA